MEVLLLAYKWLLWIITWFSTCRSKLTKHLCGPSKTSQHKALSNSYLNGTRSPATSTQQDVFLCLSGSFSDAVQWMLLLICSTVSFLYLFFPSIFPKRVSSSTPLPSCYKNQHPKELHCMARIQQLTKCFGSWFLAVLLGTMLSPHILHLCN